MRVDMEIIKKQPAAYNFVSLNAESKLRYYKISLSFFVTLVILSSVQAHVFADDDDSTTSDKQSPVTTTAITNQKIMSPREQIEHGVPPLAVVCNDGFQLIFKESNGLPACVKPDSIAALVTRGWAQSTAWEDHD